MDDPVTAVATLEEPTRRRLYDHVARQPTPVSRDDVAAATGLPRATVAFHLDKLVDERLLEVANARRTGGPGAGRPAKLYRRSDRQVTVSLPERQYELAGLLLAATLEEAEHTGAAPTAVLHRRARALGAGLAGRPVLNMLEEHGFEPRDTGAGILLGNCPFHRLARAHGSLVCGMTRSLVEGLVAGTDLHATLEPTPGACCVRVHRR